jgi:RNA polymerase sigma-70 factor, ECF subfamily
VTAGFRMADEGDSKRPALRVVMGDGERATSGTDHRGEAAPPHHGETSRIRPVDESLLAAFLVGDDDAFGELFRRNEALVLAIVRRYARTPEDARDLAQRTFLRAFEGARRTVRRGRDGVPFRRWLVTIAVNLSRNHLRDEARRPHVPLDELHAAEATQATVVAELERAERAARVRKLVLELPRRQREVLTLRLDAELPFAEIGAALGITENAAKVTFHHATRRLAALVKEAP